MNTSTSIGHEGIVQTVRDGVAFISIKHASGCSGCSIKSSCGMAETDQKILQVPLAGANAHEGDSVIVAISHREGYRAVMFSYMFPFILVVASLIASLSAGFAEPVAGAISVGVLVPYYAMLKCFGKSLKNQLSIEVKSNE